MDGNWDVTTPTSTATARPTTESRPIWEYWRDYRGAAAPPNATSAKTSATSPDPLSTTSPLYPRSYTADRIPDRVDLDSQHDPRLARASTPRGPTSNRGFFVARDRRAAAGLTSHRRPTRTFPTRETCQCCYADVSWPWSRASRQRARLPGRSRTTSCRPPRSTDQDVFSSASRTTKLPVFNPGVLPIQRRYRRLLGFADDNWHRRHPERGLQLRLSGHRGAGLRAEHDDDPRGRRRRGYVPLARRLRPGERSRFRTRRASSSSPGRATNRTR